MLPPVLRNTWQKGSEWNLCLAVNVLLHVFLGRKLLDSLLPRKKKSCFGVA